MRIAKLSQEKKHSEATQGMVGRMRAQCSFKNAKRPLEAEAFPRFVYATANATTTRSESIIDSRLVAEREAT
jgi:hypothetical protein